MMIRWLQTWHRRRVLARAQIRLDALRQGALCATDYMVRDHQIFLANAVLADLQARGIISEEERREMAGAWVNDFIRTCLPVFYREKNAAAIARLGRLMYKTAA
jgi:hypothetical protein